MRIVAWATAGIGVLTALVLGVSAQRGGLLLVSPPPPLATTSRARCPDHHLEDNGVCLPLGRARLTAPAIDLDDWVAPDSRLSAFQIPWRDAPVSPSRRGDLTSETPVRLVRTRVGAPVYCAAALSGARVDKIEKAADGAHFVTIGLDSRAGGHQTWILTGLTSVAPELQVGRPCLTETALGVSGDALVIYQPQADTASGAAAQDRATQDPATLGHAAQGNVAQDRAAQGHAAQRNSVPSPAASGSVPSSAAGAPPATPSGSAAPTRD